MKYAKLAIFSLIVVGFCAPRDTQAATFLVEEKLGEIAKNKISDVVSTSGHFLPDRCRFFNDGKASVWVSPVTNGRPAVWEEVRPGQNAGQYGVIIGDFIVTTRDPKKIYPAVVNNFGPKDTYFVKAVTGCPNNYVRFSQIQAYSQTVLRAPQLPQPIQVMEPMPVEMDWKKAKMGTPPF